MMSSSMESPTENTTSKGIWLLKGETVEKHWIQRARRNVVDFATYISDGERTPPRHAVQWLTEIFDWKKEFIILMAFPGSGKAQPLDAKISTPIGWKRMGDLKIGDELSSTNGKTSVVVGIYPQGEKDIYRVTFNDGGATECTEDHLWAVYNNNCRSKPAKILTTKQIKEDLHSANGKLKYQIPSFDPIEYKEERLELDPYLLGVILGNGGINGSSVVISTADNFIIDEVNRVLPEGYILKHNSAYEWRIAPKDGIQTARDTHSIITTLKKYELTDKCSDEKFIPDKYKFSSVKSRIALIQGLMDTGETCCKHSTLVYSTCSEKLANDFSEVVRSLGGISRVSTKTSKFKYDGEIKEGRQSYNISFSLPVHFSPFKLVRKLESYAANKKRSFKRVISKIEFVGKKEAQCIKVSADNSLYITDDYIVTHNTSVSITALGYLIGKLPHLTHMINCASEGQAKERLMQLREMIESDRYQNVFPWIHIDKKRPNTSVLLNVWSSRLPSGEECDYGVWRNFVRREGEPKDGTVFASGITSKSITGKRISGLKIIDDPHNEENSRTKEQRDRVVNIIRKEVLSRKSPGAKYAKTVLIMTPWAEDDAAGQLSKDTRKDGSKVWSYLKTPIRDDDGNPVWPELFPEEEIVKIEERSGGADSPVFDLQYRLNPLGNSSRQLTWDMLRKKLPDNLPEFKDVVISTDFAETEAYKSDWTSFFVMARDKETRYNTYVLDIVRFKEAQFAKRVDMLAKLADEVWTKWGLLNAIYMEATDSHAESQALADLRPDLPLKVIRPKGDKASRFEAAVNFLQQGRVYVNINAQGYNAWVSEMLSFPKGKHDDTCDAFDLPWASEDWGASVGAMRSGIVTIHSPYLL